MGAWHWSTFSGFKESAKNTTTEIVSLYVSLFYLLAHTIKISLNHSHIPNQYIWFINKTNHQFWKVYIDPQFDGYVDQSQFQLLNYILFIESCVLEIQFYHRWIWILTVPRFWPIKMSISRLACLYASLGRYVKLTLWQLNLFEEIYVFCNRDFSYCLQ